MYQPTLMMETDITRIREHIIQAILARQDAAFRWGFDELEARERVQYLYYTPKYKATLWTLVLLADLKAPPGLAQVSAAMRLVIERFYHPEHGIFTLPDKSHFPIPCLNGNMIYLLQYFSMPHPEDLEKTINFFAAYQRFDDGNFQTPASYPYCRNKSCYGSHTCYWGVTRLFKGLSFIPEAQRSDEARRLLAECIEFVLHHEVCFSSRSPEGFIHPSIARLTFPNFYRNDFLELLWLLAREEVHDSRMMRALDLLRARMNPAGFWELEKHVNTLVAIGKVGSPNAFITERARQVLDYYGG